MRRLFIGLIFATTLIPLILIPVLHLVPTHPAASLVINGLTVAAASHVSLSAFFYGDPDLRKMMLTERGYYFGLPIVLMLGTGIAYTVLPESATQWLLAGYFVWQTHHYQKQNYGILAFICAPAERVSALERTALSWGVLAGILGLFKIYSLVNYPEFVTVLYLLGQMAMTVAIGLFVTAVVLHPAIWRNWSRLSFLFLATFFYFPTFLFQEPIAAVSSYALAHGFQYYVFMAYIGQRNRSRWGLLIAIALPIAITLFTLSNRAGLGQSNFLFGAYLGLVMAHFVVDRRIWKMNQPFKRNYMQQAFPFIKKTNRA